MKFVFSLLVIGFVAVYSEPQYYYNNYQPLPASFFRQGDIADPAQGRFFFATQTITLATSTVTTTSTSTTTCTTSTAALSVCVASGGRRRRNFGDNSSLYYNEEDNVESIFLPSPKIERAAEPVEVPKETPAVYVPFVVQPGMMSRNEPQFRFLVAFTTATTTVTTSTTTISTLTAICSSTTSLQLCGSSGK